MKRSSKIKTSILDIFSSILINSVEHGNTKPIGQPNKMNRFNIGIFDDLTISIIEEKRLSTNTSMPNSEKVSVGSTEFLLEPLLNVLKGAIVKKLENDNDL